MAVCGIWAGTQKVQMNSAAAQAAIGSGISLPFTNNPVTPLTNNLASTNSVFVTTNLSALQLSDVVTLLLNLQTNVEQALPVIDMVESNATFASASAAITIPGAFAPITSNPAGLSATGSPNGQPPTLSVTVGTNTFAISPATLEGLILLRDDLQRTLPVLQQLNGTEPTNNVGATTFLNPGVTGFTFGPLTNSVTAPLTNMLSPILTTGTAGAF